jgi:hypothetical protein
LTFIAPSPDTGHIDTTAAARIGHRRRGSPPAPESSSVDGERTRRNGPASASAGMILDRGATSGSQRALRSGSPGRNRPDVVTIGGHSEDGQMLAEGAGMVNFGAD